MIYGGFIQIVVYANGVTGGGFTTRSPLLTEDSDDINLENGTDYIEAQTEI